MDTTKTDYLNSLEFPLLVEEANPEVCFEHFCQDYKLLLKSFGLNLSPLSENFDVKNHLIIALLKTLAERESLLRNEINNILHTLIPFSKNVNKAEKNQYLDEVIALFGMKREVTEKNNEIIYETDEAIIKRLPSRLGILSQTGTETAYFYNFLSLEASIHDVAIPQDEIQGGEVKVYLIPKIEIKTRKKEKTEIKMISLDDWFERIKPVLEEKIHLKDIIPLRDDCELLHGTLVPIEVKVHRTNSPTSEENAITNTIKHTIKNYFEKKYQFNSVISVSELTSHFDYPLSDQLTITFQKQGAINMIIECEEKEAPCLQNLIINESIFLYSEILE